jgi:hypothetical protein
LLASGVFVAQKRWLAFTPVGRKRKYQERF